VLASVEGVVVGDAVTGGEAVIVGDAVTTGDAVISGDAAACAIEPDADG
jgi:hypothetical protein